MVLKLGKLVPLRVVARVVGVEAVSYGDLLKGLLKEPRER